MNNTQSFDTPERRKAFYEKVIAETEVAEAALQAEIDAAFDAQMRAKRAQTPPRGHGATGPRTEAGKQKSRLNSYRHGLCGKLQFFTAEEKEEFALHCQGIHECLDPVGALETDLAQTVAENRWRLKCSRATSANLHAFGQLTSEPTPADLQDPQLADANLQLATWFHHHKQIQLFALYETRIQRSLDRTMVELRTLRAERVAAQAALDAARAQALEEELLLAELAESKGEIYQPTPNPLHPKFVFSTQEIKSLLARKKLLDEARSHHETTKKQTSPRQKASVGQAILPAAGF